MVKSVMKSFSELEGQSHVTVEDFIDTLSDYATSGAVINVRVVCSLMDRVKPTQVERIGIERIARNGYERQGALKRTKGMYAYHMIRSHAARSVKL